MICDCKIDTKDPIPKSKIRRVRPKGPSTRDTADRLQRSATMLSMIHGRALARAAPSGLRNYSGVGVGVGGAAASTSSARLDSIAHQSTGTDRHHRPSPLPFSWPRPLGRIQRRPGVAMAYSSIAGGLLRDGRTGLQRDRGASATMTRRTNFSYAGPRKLSDIIKTELLTDKTATEIVSLAEDA